MIGRANVVMKMPEFRSGRQYWTMRPAAVRLLARTTTYLQK